MYVGLCRLIQGIGMAAIFVFFSAVRTTHAGAVQQSYIPAHNPLENIPTERTRCAWYPKCKKNRIICKGLNRKNCIHFKHRDGDEDFVNEMLSEKKELKKQRDREMKRIKRRRLRTNI